MSHLFSPFSIREIEFRNRIAVSPMCMYSSHDGFANDWHLVHLGSRAVGGAALVIAEATAVSPEGRISIADLGIWKDDHIEYLQKITHFISQQGAVPGIQLAHAGRKAGRNEPWNGDKIIPETEGGWKVVAPSNIPFLPEYSIPESLTKEGIEKVVSDFSNATERALRAGFQVIEIHGAHGYLIHEFLSPLANKRTDNYGGSFENRIRLLLDIISGVRRVWPAKYPLFVRISATDWVEGGWTIEDSFALVDIIKSKGVDLIDCSSGGVMPGVKIPVAPGYQVPFAEQIHKLTGISTGAVGMILTPSQAEQIIARGQANLVIIAREFLRDPYFPMHAALELEEDIIWPNQYLRAKRKK